MKDRLRIVVSGLVAASPVGGMAWHYFQYLIGLHRMGHDVAYHEDTWSWPFDPVANTFSDDPAFSIGFLKAFFERFAPDLADRWHYRHLHGTSFGMTEAAFDKFAAGADVWLNVSGASFPPSSLPGRCVRMFIDTDPGYNQMLMAGRFGWAENVDRWIEQVRSHDVHFTFAENINGTECSIPHVGLDWIPTRMPIVLDLWRDAERKVDEAWTTVMTWSAFKGPIEYAGRRYYSKGHEFRKFLDVARRAGVPMSVALGGIDAPRKDIEEAGWTVLDGPQLTRSPEGYQSFIQDSRGEFSTAKHIYVATRSGWFSERSACYLAAGRPVVVQDTGFSRHIRSDAGLVPFSSLDEAIGGVEAVESAYEHHARAARDVAEREFEASGVLGRLLDAAGGTRSHPPEPDVVKPHD